MTWLLPTLKDVPAAGTLRCVVNAEPSEEEKRAARRAYHRAYYHLVRKAKRVTKPRTPEQKARAAELARERYAADPDHFRALARASYWRRHPAKDAAK